MVAEEHAHVRPFPDEAIPRRRATDQVLQAEAIGRTFDIALDTLKRRNEKPPSLATVDLICRVYHAQLRARGGRP